MPTYWLVYSFLLRIVRDKGKLRKVHLRPTDLIDYSLSCYGSSLRGAIDGAKMLLGKITMSAIVISIYPNMYWFPSISPAKESCAWLRFCHVKDYALFSKKQTKMSMQDNSEVVLDTSYYSFDEKINRINKLKYMVGKQLNSGIIFEHKAPYIIRKHDKERKYCKYGDGPTI